MNANTRCIKGDFIGFTLGNIHSSELGLVRVSDGSRYNEDLLPPLQDKKAQVAGRDGEVYFGSQYTTKPIKVPVAFDNMREEDFSKLRRLLSIKTPQVLWFDENPYKQWLVKSASAQSFKWVCFDESGYGREKRLYKGEGTLEFSCFTPYATSRFTYLNEAEDYANLDEWREGSGLRQKEIMIKTASHPDGYKFEYGKTVNAFEIENKFSIKDFQRRGMFVYNAGDIPIKPQIICEIPTNYATTEDILLRIYCLDDPEVPSEEFYQIGELTISKEILTRIQGTNGTGDTHLIIDSKLKMIKGAKQVDDIQQLTGNIYNKFHKSGDYFEIPVSTKEVYFIEIIEQGSDNLENPIIQNTAKEDLIKISSVKYVHQYY